MKTKRKPIFSFIHDGQTVAAIQASNKDEARARIEFIQHIVQIPKDCKVKRRRTKFVMRAPVFFDGHFLAIENALADY